MQVQMFPDAWTEQGLNTVHVPLLFYAPGYPKQLKPSVSKYQLRK
jgi:hypothetical protein